MSTVIFDHVTKRYGDSIHAVDDFYLEVEEGEFVILVGPSGCGKTTALLMTAGLEKVSEGEILIGGRVVNNLDPRERDIAMVFQNYALYPHLTVYENLGFGLRTRKVPKKEIDERVREIAGALGLHDLLKRKPRQLSGGQRQRVAMGRAIVRDASVFLMDEPLSNLDAKLRVKMRGEISRIQHELHATTIYVTHDQVEAMTMADRVAVMRMGQLQQVDAPQRLYDDPANLFVASFIGSPEMNLIHAQLDRSDGRFLCRMGDQYLVLSPAIMERNSGLAEHAGRSIGVGIRPEDISDANRSDPTMADNVLHGHVELKEALGSELLAHIAIDAEPIRTAEVLEVARDVDAGLAEEQGDRAILVGRFDARSPLRVGDPSAIAVDIDRMHFFDLETGLAIGRRN